MQANKYLQRSRDFVVGRLWSAQDFGLFLHHIQFRDGDAHFYFRRQSSDEAVIKHVLMEQQYDLRRLRRASELLAFAQRREASGLRPLVVDANIGASAIYFAGNLRNALVVAIEPDLENFNLLCKNVEGLSVEPVHGAISSVAGRAHVFDPGEGHWGYRTRPIAEHDAAADAVACVTINDIYLSHAATFFPFIAKIDVEGGERDLFSSNTEWVARTPLLVVELHDWLLPKEGTSRPFLDCISKLDRDFVYIGEDIYSIANDLDALAP
jgi:FkbM family methyltransferase